MWTWILLLITASLSIRTAVTVAQVNEKEFEAPIVVAHRGASGYLPEHTLAAKALAHGMNPDFIEQDVVLTKDDHLVVLHDIQLDTVTDVAKKFADRKRKDNRYYAIDFTLAEIKTLEVSERFKLKDGSAEYKSRFPVWKSAFKVPTLEEEIELIEGLNKSRDKNIGIYVEIKAPTWHKEHGKDIERRLVEVLAKYGYVDGARPVYVQCFDASSLKRLRTELKSKLPLVQLIGENGWRYSPTDFDAMKTEAGMKAVAEYADAVAPWIAQMYLGKNKDGTVKLSDLHVWAKKYKLAVHPYTFRKDALPEGIASLTELFDLFLKKMKVDGMFTDFPDLGRDYVATHFSRRM